MEKDFLEVFLGLEVEKELKALLEDVKVTKIGSQSEKRPYESLHSEHTVDSEKIHLCSGKADKETVFCFSADTDKNH